jgi:threonine synthase
MEKFYCAFCNRFFPADPFQTFCPNCKEPLLIHLSPKTKHIGPQHHPPLKKFLDFLPFQNIDPRLDMGEGNTPLTPCSKLSESLGLPTTFLKDETLNPTGSFKDRGSRLSVQKAMTLGFSRIGTVSTGNMAASTAAYGARAGLETNVLIKMDVSPEKLISAGVHGARLFQVNGDYGDLFWRSLKAGEKNSIYFMNSVDPYRIEGYKITGFEIFEKLESEKPLYIFVPVSSGGHMIGLIKAYRELRELSYVKKFPVFVGIQAQGCSPLARAFIKNTFSVNRIRHAQTIAQSISNPDPPGGNLALKWIREHHGSILAVSDNAILKAQRILAREEGRFMLPASASALAGVIQWNSQKAFPEDARVVMVMTGTGLKSIKSIDSSNLNLQQCSLDELDKVLI